MYEHQKQPLANRKTFTRRLLNNAIVAFGMLLGSLLIGVFGYRFLENLSWVDSLLNASMILGGMGPVSPLQTTAGKIFASFYALYSGVVLLASVGVLATPIFHRFLHHFHLQDDE
jgi:ABC-type glycerol-3-phosphate transport system permease component